MSRREAFFFYKMSTLSWENDDPKSTKRVSCRRETLSLGQMLILSWENDSCKSENRISSRREANFTQKRDLGIPFGGSEDGTFHPPAGVTSGDPRVILGVTLKRNVNFYLEKARFFPGSEGLLGSSQLTERETKRIWNTASEKISNIQEKKQPGASKRGPQKFQNEFGSHLWSM